MNRPTSLTCLVGRPGVCLALLGVYALIVLGWLHNEASWWVAMLAIWAAKGTLVAYQQLKRYNAWLAQWDAMGQPVKKPAAAPEPQRAVSQSAISQKNVGGRVLVGIAALIAVSIPFSGMGSSDGVVGVWFGACVFLAWRLIGAIRGRGGSGGVVAQRSKPEAVGNAPVAWLLDRASSSPSRMEAMRNLPDYSARLISQ
jgi:hypothetical protein